MKNIYYMIRNESGSDGQYLLDDKYHILSPGQKEILSRKPINTTQNIIVSMFKREETYNPEPHKIPINVQLKTPESKSPVKSKSKSKDNSLFKTPENSESEVIQSKRPLKTVSPYQRLGSITEEVKELEDDLAKNETKVDSEKAK